MLTDRDPRKDPKVGDVMAVAPGVVEVTGIIGPQVHYLLTAQSGPPVYRIPMACTAKLSLFRKQMKFAEVIHHAD